MMRLNSNVVLLVLTLTGTLAMIAGVSWWSIRQTQQAVLEIPLADLVPSDASVLGASESAEVTIVEFSDFQCPACASVSPLVKEKVRAASDSTRLVFRHFPLPQHQHAQTAAQAAEAAGKQGKFWEMHDQLFAGQVEWAEAADAQPIFRRYAENLGLDLEQYDTDLLDPTIKAKIQRDYAQASKLKLPGTPTFFRNGQLVSAAELLQ